MKLDLNYYHPGATLSDFPLRTLILYFSTFYVKSISKFAFRVQELSYLLSFWSLDGSLTLNSALGRGGFGDQVVLVHLHGSGLQPCC